MARTETQQGDSAAGFGFALAAYVMWGFLPFYMKAVSHIDPAVIVAHRILWSIPIAGAWILYLRRSEELRRAFRTPSMLGMALVTACFIAVNWGIYVWAIANDRALETALGYYVNPLFTVALGALVLKETMTRLQIAAIGCAVVAVAIVTWEGGGLPWTSLGLVFSWGLYAFCRKTLPIGPNQGFFLEVLVLSPIALGFLIYVGVSGGALFGDGSATDLALLAGAGLVTAVPLILYANGAKLLRLSTIGVMQYVAPTMIFLIAVFVFGEPFGIERLVAFVFIWLALGLYTASLMGERRRARARLPAVEPGTRT